MTINHFTIQSFSFMLPFFSIGLSRILLTAYMPLLSYNRTQYLALFLLFAVFLNIKKQ